MCTQCSQLEAKISRLEAKIKRLETKIKRIHAAATRLEDNAAGRQAQGGLSRAAWSYLKAVRLVATVIKQLCG